MALLVGGISSGVIAFIHPNNYVTDALSNPGWAPAHVVGGLALLVMVLRFAALHLRQVEEVGRLGLIGFILALFGSAALTNVARVCAVSNCDVVSAALKTRDLARLIPCP